MGRGLAVVVLKDDVSESNEYVSSKVFPVIALACDFVHKQGGWCSALVWQYGIVKDP